MKSEDVIKEIELRLAVEVAQLWPLQGEWREEDYFSLPDTKYAKAGVEEYWIVDPDAETIEVFVLRRGAYVMLGKWGKGEVARSEVLKGFEVKVNEVVG
jgi:Uma2 family endonuclease